MTSIKATESLERMLVGGSQLRQEPGSGGTTALYQTVVEATDRLAAQGHVLVWATGLLVMMVLALVVRVPHRLVGLALAR